MTIYSKENKLSYSDRLWIWALGIANVFEVITTIIGINSGFSDVSQANLFSRFIPTWFYLVIKTLSITGACLFFVLKDNKYVKNYSIMIVVKILTIGFTCFFLSNLIMLIIF